MTAVLIHPSGGAGRGKINWSKTLGNPVDFTAEEHAPFLTPEQRDALLKLHPEGTARFWGTFDEPNRERYLRETGPGAAVVFTASSHARGIGVIGAVFKNAAFADTLWAPDADKGSYALVYSVLEFEETAIPYPEVRSLLGKGPDYPFRQLALATEPEAQEFGDAVAAGTAAFGQGLELEAPVAGGGVVPTGATAPGKVTVVGQRIVRDGAVARWVKRHYADTCQFCGTTLATRTGTYSEAAHIRALGGGHAGADTPSNILCLCPNDHVRFDTGAIHIHDGKVIDTLTGQPIGTLTVNDGHDIDFTNALYHREHFAGIA